MDQLQLSLLGCITGPGAVPVEAVAPLRSYRAAVRAAWINRRVQGMTLRTLAERTCMRASHVSDYLSDDPVDSKGRERRDMPAKFLPAFEAAVGNTFVTQWLSMQSQQAIQESLRAA